MLHHRYLGKTEDFLGSEYARVLNMQRVTQVIEQNAI